MAWQYSRQVEMSGTGRCPPHQLLLALPRHREQVHLLADHTEADQALSDELTGPNQRKQDYKQDKSIHIPVLECKLVSRNSWKFW